MAIATGLALASAGCPGPTVEETPSSTSADPDRPYVVVVGSAQDGGVPHAGCDCSRCQSARHDPARRRYVASLAICLPGTSEIFLIDATPDVGEQLEMVRDLRSPPAGAVDRTPVDGVFLTHAHIGHYLGLAWFGYEVMHTRELPVYATKSVLSFLESNGPWDQLVRLGNIAPVEIAPGNPVELGSGVSVTAIAVPHRDEYTDTVGFIVAGPDTRLLYVPDTDGWDGWAPPLTAVLDEIDVALLDGTFFSAGELPGRDLSSIGHPLIVDTMDLLETEVAKGRPRVFFVHLNHSNPALEPESAEAKEIARRGFRVAREGRRLAL
ncbi:MAG: MBL fold metallo-hydrolase [Acidobacteriota bacterium]|nr:MBL fold metallo-hydrolase [Acidobacteriota bacterium]